MRLFSRLLFCAASFLTFFALLQVPARADNDAVYVITYLEAPPLDAISARSAAARVIAHYRDASRKEPGNARADALIEQSRPNRLVIVEAWRDAASLAAHDKADSSAAYRQAITPLLSAPPDIRTTSGFYVDPSAHGRPDAVYVVTHIDVTGDHKDDALALLRTMSGDTTKDPGNLDYNVFQQKNRPNHFTVVEAWTDRKAQGNHAAAAHTRTFRQQLLPLAGALYDERLYTLLP